MHVTRRFSRLALGASALVLSATLAACGGANPDSSTPSPKPHPYPTPPATSVLGRERERDVAYPVLPPIRSLAASYPEHHEELARGVSRIQLESRNAAIGPEDRSRHAVLVRDLLVAINSEYRTRFGTPPPPSSSSFSSRAYAREEPRGLEREVRDVEMIAV